MNVHGHGEYQHQGDEIRRYDGHLPVQETEHPDHEQNRVKTSQQRQDYPSQFSEQDGEGCYDEDEHTKAEYDQILLDEGDHVIGDHGNPTEIHGPVFLIGTYNRSNPLDVLVPLFAIGGIVLIVLKHILF